MNGFDFLANLPLLVFVFISSIVFIIFIWGGIVLLRAKGDEEKKKKGRRILLNSLYGFLAILIIVVVFFLVSYFLQRGKVLQPPEISEEFPPSLAVNFPPPPQFIKVGKYCFNGPWLLKENEFVKEPALYLILCKKNEEYDIIYIGQTEGGESLLRQEQYRCWIDNCEQGSNNLYLGIFWTDPEKYKSKEREEIKEQLKTQINPPCPPLIE
jgi:amino acid transporter